MTLYKSTEKWSLHHGDVNDVLRGMEPKSVHCVVTSPPYWGLRDYGIEDQLGLEPTLEGYVENMVDVFREVRRVLRDDGTLWLNLGDSYAASMKGSGGRSGLKKKDLIGIPWRVAFALQADGWYLRSDIIWHKDNPMPESVTDRPTKSHEYMFLMSKSPKYYFDAKAVKEPAVMRPQNRFTNGRGNKDDGYAPHRKAPGMTNPTVRNIRTVWTIPTKPYKGAHFATFPPRLVEPCIKAGSPIGGVVLDPFIGSGTTIFVANQLGRQGVGIDLNKDYLDLAVARIEA